MLSELNKVKLFMKWFGLCKVPLLGYTRHQLIELTNERAEIKIPLSRRTKNHLNSMYFGALAVGVDTVVGTLVLKKIFASKKNISLVFKDFQANFLKRAEGDVYFVCEQGQLVDDLLEKVISTGERQHITIPAFAVVKKGAELIRVAEFSLTPSLKLQQ